LLGGDGDTLLKEEKYTPFFRLLLYIEEHQMKNDIHVYDCDGQKMKVVEENRKLLSLKVWKTEIHLLKLLSPTTLLFQQRTVLSEYCSS
jgi:hypothetical protein